MHITKVEAFPVAFPLDVPARDATGVWDSWNTVIVKITASDGTSGYGEIGPIHGGGIPIFTAMVDHKLKHIIMGEDPFNREGLYEKMLGRGTGSYALGQKGAVVTAVAGIDIALWDLTGKILKTPAWNLLGGKAVDKIPAYASGFFGKEGRPLTPQECADEAKSYADQGFKGVKMKVGFGRSEDLKNLEAVRKALGPEPGIMVDANQSYSYHDVLKIAGELAAFDLTFLEEPLPINDLDGMAALVQNVATPIAAGENYYTRYEFREIFSKRAVNIIQPDIIHAGGITETKKIASMASAANIPLAPHIHATVGVPASIHLLASCENTLAAEYITSGGSYKLRRELYGDCCIARDGYVTVPDEPGLGMRINEEIFEKYRPKGM
ncbi:mandelate racemase/muconate lactonizing enzyme family protein [Marispirochaeta aestuarii]|uniref:mandelate racemase/muconate lactonizing enzyme family protein n=1 Tax=Marispirochaeta aestuarii TaxID=1963862 RepID=UPI0029C84F2D|nr:mandelate racemase/muconate lactonizing enzyme family protein [Marispirochaeta aestuarii]